MAISTSRISTTTTETPTNKLAFCGTDETFTHVDSEPLDDRILWDIAVDHASSYGNEYEGDGEWSEYSEAECWLEGVATTKEELGEFSGELLFGSMTFEDLVKELEDEGMVWQ